jgi:hypothetical protein
MLKKLALTTLLVGASLVGVTACVPVPPPISTPGLVVFEDGSARDANGVVYPDGTYAWDCSTMGNKVCGPGAN